MANKQGQWDPDRADEIEADLASMTNLIDEIQEIRDGISNNSWVCHERLGALQMKIWDKRIAHLMTLQGIAPEKNSLAKVPKKELLKQLIEYQKELETIIKQVA